METIIIIIFLAGYLAITLEHNLKIDKEISESISGSIRFANRPLGLEMMSEIKKGDHIICSALDRFSRNTLDLLQTIEKFKKMKARDVNSSLVFFWIFVQELAILLPLYLMELSKKVIDNLQQSNSAKSGIGLV